MDDTRFPRTCPCRRTRRLAGVTLLEVMTAVLLGSTFMGMVASVLLAGTRATDAVVKESSAASSLERTLETITENLRRSSTTRITITPDSGQNSILNLQVLSAADGVTWGAERFDGTFVADWSTTFQRSGTDLVRQTVDGMSSVVEQAVLAIGVQDPSGGQGFEVTVTNSVYLTTLNLTKTFGPGESFERNSSASVFVRN